MDNWLDAQAKRAAEGGSGRDVSRRTMLKRAGVVGAGVWAAPVLQSVLAPTAALATGQQTTCAGNNSPACGQGCTGGLCGQANICLSTADCQSGYVCGPKASDGKRYCTVGATGLASSTCASPADKYCYTNSGCIGNSGKCDQSSAGGYCRVDTDCKKGACTNVGAVYAGLGVCG